MLQMAVILEKKRMRESLESLFGSEELNELDILNDIIGTLITKT